MSWFVSAFCTYRPPYPTQSAMFKVFNQRHETKLHNYNQPHLILMKHFNFCMFWSISYLRYCQMKAMAAFCQTSSSSPITHHSLLNHYPVSEHNLTQILLFNFWLWYITEIVSLQCIHTYIKIWFETALKVDFAPLWPSGCHTDVILVHFSGNGAANSQH